tara:strand:+ start:55 stop:486 length:432 start_codon:yes stop_codon:yes gene_type:complete
MKIIEEPLYKKIIKSVPILCVDLIISYNEKYLLIKRKQNPLKNKWWVPGGRVLIGERVEDAVGRKLYEELSISKSDSFKLIGFYEDFFDVSSFGSHFYHTFSMVFKLELIDLPDVITDKSISGWMLNNNLPKRFESKLELINV